MLVRLCIALSFEDGARAPGDVVDLSESHAAELMRLGLAEPVESLEPVEPVEPESAALGIPPEQAIVPKARKRG